MLKFHLLSINYQYCTKFLEEFEKYDELFLNFQSKWDSRIKSMKSMEN